MSCRVDVVRAVGRRSIDDVVAVVVDVGVGGGDGDEEEGSRSGGGGDRVDSNFDSSSKRKGSCTTLHNCAAC